MAGFFAFLDSGGHVFLLSAGRHLGHTIDVRKLQKTGCRAFLIR